MRVDDLSSVQRPSRVVEPERQFQHSVGQQHQQAAKPVTTQAADPVHKKNESAAAGDRQSRAAANAMQLPNEEKLAAIAETLQNKLPEIVRASVTFEVRPEHPPVLVLRDAESGEELRRIPPEDVLELAEALEDLKGLIVDARAGEEQAR